MAKEYYTKAELDFIKIWALKAIAGSVADDESRPWMPVTYIDPTSNNRVTVRAPYPMGDGDETEVHTCPTCEGDGHVSIYICKTCGGSGQTLQDCPECNGTGFIDGDCTKGECPNCAGSGHLKLDCLQCHGSGKIIEPSGESGTPCPTCGGTGAISGAGPIHVTPNGIIQFRYDELTLGIDESGKVYARLKARKNGGLDTITGEYNELYVKVDQKSIQVNPDTGCLEVIDYVKPYAEQFSNSVVFTQEIEYSSNPISLSDGGKEIIVNDEAVKKIHVHLSVGIRNDNYWSATSMTRLQMNVGGKLSEIFCWDQTIPYTIVNFDTFIDVSNERTVPVWLKFKEGAIDDSIPKDATFSWTANVTSC